jgi:regulator of protease activity HflC (stomatin/prohibitin superfamily)
MTEPTKGIRSWIEGHFIAFSSTLLILFLLTPYLLANMFVTVPAGHGGALWLRFFGGTVLDFYFGEGTKVIFPWDKIYVYDTRVQQKTEKLDVLTRDGLQISVEVTARFRLRPDSLGAITAYAGPGFVDNLLMPSVAAVVRLEAAKQAIEEVYSTGRATLEQTILAGTRQMVSDLIPNTLHSGEELDIQDIRIRGIVLPLSVQTAIENKLTQFQLSQQYKYILAREEQERERKQIEAQGIKAFQDIVSSGISENYLRWKGIDATLKLADSPNAKIVIIGGKEGLPVILGPLDSGNSAAAPLKVPGVEQPAASSAVSPPRAAASISGGSSDSVPSSSSAGPPPMPAATTPANPALSMPSGTHQRR